MKKTDEELEKEMLEDLDYIYQIYRTMLDSGKSNTTLLNTVIRALKESHRYFNPIENKNEKQKPT